MDKVARLSEKQRQELFQETASRMGIHPAVIEKDFWVCWVLNRIFQSALKKHLIFKGGTTLSKIFKIIERFSEDVDLILDWTLLGYGEEDADPHASRSRTQQNRFNHEVNERAAQYLADSLVPELRQHFGDLPDIALTIDESDPHTIDVSYPSAFSVHYILPAIRLEIGPLAAWEPHSHHVIQAYAAECFPRIFDQPKCDVIATSAERTFWEKATLLHQEANRPPNKATPARYSRHYYDLGRLAESPIRERALDDLDLLQQVVSFKKRFYYSAWAKYEEARSGSFKVIPSDERLGQLQRDYSEMEVMIFGEVPEFRAIVTTLRELEQEINALE